MSLPEETFVAIWINIDPVRVVQMRDVCKLTLRLYEDMRRSKLPEKQRAKLVARYAGLFSPQEFLHKVRYEYILKEAVRCERASLWSLYVNSAATRYANIMAFRYGSRHFKEKAVRPQQLSINDLAFIRGLRGGSRLLEDWIRDTYTPKEIFSVMRGSHPYYHNIPARVVIPLIRELRSRVAVLTVNDAYIYVRIHAIDEDIVVRDPLVILNILKYAKIVTVSLVVGTTNNWPLIHREVMYYASRNRN